MAGIWYFSALKGCTTCSVVVVCYTGKTRPILTPDGVQREPASVFHLFTRLAVDVQKELT